MCRSCLQCNIPHVKLCAKENLKPKTKVETNVILHLHSCFKLIVKNQDCQRNSKKVHLMQYTAGSLTEEVSFILSPFSQEKIGNKRRLPKKCLYLLETLFPLKEEKKHLQSG